MYENLRCDCSIRNNLLDKQPGCALHNVLLYLECIEAAAICIMRIISYIKKKKTKKSELVSDIISHLSHHLYIHIHTYMFVCV